MIAYAVSSGEYSDYRVHAVFASAAEAERYAADHSTGRYDDHDVEEMEYFPEGEGPQVTRYFVANACSAWRNQDVEVSMTAEDDPDGKLLRDLKRPRVEVKHHPAVHLAPAWVHVSARALDRVAAQKACADRWAQVRAEMAGIA